MRRLLIVPIVHSLSDLGSLAGAVSQAKVAALGTERRDEVVRSIDMFWQAVTQTLQSMSLDYANLLIYQDGLPVIENSALELEQKIVRDLARAGSQNHRLVLWFTCQGACLVGTESAPLLMQEYAAVRKSLEDGFRQSDCPAETTDASEQPSLMEQRDQFIANRIDATLGLQQTGLLFIGMLHSVETHLPDDIALEYPVGRPTISGRALLDARAALPNHR